MERKKVGESFNLEWTGEDIQTNISLKAKLLEAGIELPDFEFKRYGEVIDHYIASVRRAVSRMDGWEVNNNVALGFFSFTKFVMYNDLKIASGLIWGKIYIDTVKEFVALTNLSNDSLTEIETKITSYMMEAKKEYGIILERNDLKSVNSNNFEDWAALVDECMKTKKYNIITFLISDYQDRKEFYSKLKFYSC